MAGWRDGCRFRGDQQLVTSTERRIYGREIEKYTEGKEHITETLEPEKMSA